MRYVLWSYEKGPAAELPCRQRGFSFPSIFYLHASLRQHFQEEETNGFKPDTGYKQVLFVSIFIQHLIVIFSLAILNTSQLIQINHAPSEAAAV